MKAANSHRSQSRFDRLSPLLVLAFFVAAALGCEEITSKAKGRASNLQCKHDARIVNGELDYGVTVHVTVKNVADQGVIKILSEVSTSEGDLSRDQKLTFGAGESKDLTYFYDQPTINASNIECRVKLSPSAD